MSKEILIRGGHVIDPANNIDKTADVLIRDGKIAAVGDVPVTGEMDLIDAANRYVVPGLVDFHTHVFKGGSQFGFNADLLVPYGVVTCVDAGTAGCLGYEAFHCVNAMKEIKVYAFLNICSMGQLGRGFNENTDPDLIDVAAIKAVLAKYSGEIRGLKVRVSKAIVGKFGEALIRKTIEVANECNLPICVHCTDPCVPMGELVKQLRPGDVLCHIYHGKGSGILDENGDVLSEVIDAAKRGVIMDCANGRTNFSFAVAKKAMANGFLPDIISTDLTAATVSNGSMVRSLPFLMSKYLNMGMSLPEIIPCVTVNPAKALGLTDGIGTLSIGTEASIAVLDEFAQPCTFMDADGECLSGSRMLSNLMTIHNGKIVYDSNVLQKA